MDEQISAVGAASGYVYLDMVRQDILRMVPADGLVIGTIGCGRAATEQVLVDQGRTVHGVDVAEEAVAVARTRLTSARRVAPDELQPFDLASLDGLILADVIEHIPRARQAFVAYAQMVRPGGWILLSVPNMRYLECLFELVVKGDWPEHPLGIFDETHVQVMTHRRVKRWAAQAGLVPEKWFPCYDFRFFRRNVYRLLDVVTLRLLRGLFNFEVQVRLRRPL